MRTSGDGTGNGRARCESVRVSELSVAVVVTCFNYGRFLGEAVDSVLAQTVSASRIVVVDDGSTDDTKAVATGYGAQLTYIWKPNGGPGSARNAGIDELARVSPPPAYVIFLDADDTLVPNYIERCLSANTTGKADTIIYNQLRFTGENSGVSTYPHFSLDALKRANIIHVSALIPFKALDRRRFEPTLRPHGLEDWDLYLGLAEDGVRGVLVDEPLLVYRRHEHAISHSLVSNPWRLARLRWRLLVRHRRLYGSLGFVRQALSVVADLWNDVDFVPRLRRAASRRLRPER